eukprot:351768-Chlamydomonas_euryale.AAC.5
MSQPSAVHLKLPRRTLCYGRASVASIQLPQGSRLWHSCGVTVCASGWHALQIAPGLRSLRVVFKAKRAAAATVQLPCFVRNRARLPAQTAITRQPTLARSPPWQQLTRPTAGHQRRSMRQPVDERTKPLKCRADPRKEPRRELPANVAEVGLLRSVAVPRSCCGVCVDSWACMPTPVLMHTHMHKHAGFALACGVVHTYANAHAFTCMHANA